MPLPALLTIQSGINQLRYATLKGIMAAKKKEIKKVARAGAVASRQKSARALRAAEVEADRHDRRVACRSRERAGQAASRGGARPMILVVAEQKDGKLNRASWEAIAAAQQLARWQAIAGDQLPVPVTDVVRCGAGARGGRCQRASSRSRIPRSAPTRPTPSSRRSQQIIEQTSPQYVVFPHTYQTRDFAPALAATIDRALVTDVIGHPRGWRRRRRLRARCSRAS